MDTTSALGRSQETIESLSTGTNALILLSGSQKLRDNRKPRGEEGQELDSKSKQKSRDNRKNGTTYAYRVVPATIAEVKRQ